MRNLLASATLVISLLLVSNTPALALGTGAVCDQGNVQGSGNTSFCQNQPGGNGSNPIAGPNGAINKAVEVLAIVAGVAAVIIIIIAGLRYILSGGDSNTVSQAKNTIIYALIGLVVIIAGQAIIRYIISKL